MQNVCRLAALAATLGVLLGSLAGAIALGAKKHGAAMKQEKQGAAVKHGSAMKGVHLTG